MELNCWQGGIFPNFLNLSVGLAAKTFTGQPVTPIDFATVCHAAGCRAGRGGEDGPMRRHQRGSTPDVAQHVEHDARAKVIQLYRQFPHARQALANGALLLHGAENEQEAPTAGAGQLGA